MNGYYRASIFVAAVVLLAYIAAEYQAKRILDQKYVAAVSERLSYYLP